MNEYFWARVFSKDAEGNEAVDKEEHFNSRMEAQNQIRKWSEEDKIGLYTGFSINTGDSEGEPLEPNEEKSLSEAKQNDEF